MHVLLVNSSYMLIVTTNVERLGLRIAAPAKDGKANKEMISFLAKVLGIRKSALSIVEVGLTLVRYEL